MKKLTLIIGIVLIALSSCKKNSRKCHSAELRSSEAGIKADNAGFIWASNPTNETADKYGDALDEVKEAAKAQERACN